MSKRVKPQPSLSQSIRHPLPHTNGEWLKSLSKNQQTRRREAKAQITKAHLHGTCITLQQTGVIIKLSFEGDHGLVLQCNSNTNRSHPLPFFLRCRSNQLSP